MADPTPSGKPRGSLFEELKRRHVVRVGVAYAVTAWLVLQLGDILFPALRAPQWCMPVLIGFLVLGFPVALVLAWAFEITPGGVRRTEPAQSPAARPAAQGRRVGSTLTTITIVVLAAVVAVLGWRQFVHPHVAAKAAGSEVGAAAAATGTAASSRSIAVLPFLNGSGNPKNQYFSDGLSEEFIVALSHLPGLKVIDRESSFQFRGKDLGSKAIGRKLGVAHLLEGSVTREGDEVRMRAELVSTADGSTQWSQTFDRPYRNLFKLQDDLTKAVATALQAKLVSGANGAPAHADRPPSGSLAAYNAYIEGNFDVQRRTEAGMRRAIDAYRKAIQLDPRYAAAFAGLSRTWGALSPAFLSGADRQAAYDSAAVAADSALALDPNLAAAHVARGTLLSDRMDWSGAEAAYRKALELAPGNAGARRSLAVMMATLGRLKDAVRLEREALGTNPLDALGEYDLGAYLLGLRRADEALRAGRRALEIQPTAAAFHTLLVQADIVRGDTAAALRAAAGEPSPPWRRWALAMAPAAAGDTARANGALRTLMAKDGDLAAFQIADVYALRQEPDQAFAWLDRAWKQRDPGIGSLLYDPFLHRYEKDPRFAAFCRKAGLPVPGERDSGAATASRS